jgi:threonyl-tRNA synthetase
LVRLRHSAAHVLAMAVQRLFPRARVAAGPWTEHGYGR